MISIYEDYHSRAVSGLPWQMAGEERQAAVEKIKAGFPYELRKAVERSVTADTAKKETHLKEIRLRNGMSQSRLAAASGVPLRTIQQYEQRRKDIRKAGFEYIMGLSKALHCEPADLMERLT
jgi:DNA-binding transcriptional regulator YiaG